MTGWEDDSHGIVQKMKFDHTNGISTNQHLSWKFKDSKNGKKKNCMDISSDKQVKFHMRKLGHG